MDKEVTKVFAVSGFSGIGKSTLCKRLKYFANFYGISADIVQLDTYMLNREQRREKGLEHGYGLEAHNINLMIEDLDNVLFNDKPIFQRPYNHKTGKHSEKPIIREPSNIMIIDGAIALTDLIHDRYQPIGLFLDIEDKLMRPLKIYTDKKRNYTDNKQISENNVTIYNEAYLKYCRPQRKNADIVFELYKINPRERIYRVVKSG